jgi:beta-1,4-mannosyl-glycoprotein beta-1,4-N-acetylglucosaminyltransferase
MTKVIDCVTYFDEDLILDIRFNILDNYVDYFVVVEATRDHQNNPKSLKFDIKNFSKFEKKIIYLVQEDINYDEFKETNKAPDLNHFRDQSQRNYIMNGLKNFDDDDCILISDCDEIPRPELILKNFLTFKKFFIFQQNMYYYKLNTQISSIWQGTRMCAKKNLKSPNFLREIKSKDKFLYNFKKRIKLIENGGWHFSYLKKPDDIIKKIEAFAHQEYNLESIKNIDYVKYCISNQIDMFSNYRGNVKNKSLCKVKIDSSFPEYIRNNQEKFSYWIA